MRMSDGSSDVCSSDLTPPASGSYTGRTESGRGPARPVETAAAEPAEPPQCATSRANIALLESESPVQQDTDGDGEPDRTLDDTERANQLNLARALPKANCPGGDAPARSEERRVGNECVRTVRVRWTAAT